MPCRPRIRYAIFDMDGLLLDTERCYYQAASAILGERGLTLSDEVNAARLGLKAEESTKLILESTGASLTPEEYRLELRKRQTELWRTVKPLPGAMTIVNRLKSVSIPISIATSSALPEFSIKRSACPDLFSLFEGCWVLGDDPRVSRGKPEPDIFQEAARRMGVKEEGAREVLVFEDSPNGVLAALRANMVPIWVIGSDPAFLGLVYERGGDVVHSLEDVRIEDWGIALPSKGLL
ncbi:HAD-like protein [Gonapodya prolifera JEL478]|uniref:HAD-like protein n=1 Tax=Gonapodya prolifera (strain JEL478) TaxID=1344416 RepID=A0A139A3T6_GONPJ|nr:HAD-like protein [Gonapodya prolifera JEL478]|eukprot:KXS11329.1 HAD-like protein [Gonapodya prolifera JEL478]